MLRLNDKIRLTPRELSAFDAVAGVDKTPPTTVAEHDRRLEEAAEAWAGGESAEEKLLEHLARDLKIERNDSATEDVATP